ncbi:hypothetical protein JZ751_015482 [Albula glossodonta]|uniref:Uncharacterized protein n=1 Tax=Albula glossodonta TaxID=121402 RepID=A0A8T2MYH1_9TELE|nr:hypothetical protein JZ751_015482 [Albula glossodonta]
MPNRVGNKNLFLKNEKLVSKAGDIEKLQREGEEMYPSRTPVLSLRDRDTTTENGLRTMVGRLVEGQEIMEELEIVGIIPGDDGMKVLTGADNVLSVPSSVMDGCLRHCPSQQWPQVEGGSNLARKLWMVAFEWTSVTPFPWSLSITSFIFPKKSARSAMAGVTIWRC